MEISTEILKDLKKDGTKLRMFENDIRSNKIYVLEAVKQNGYSLQYGSSELRNDKEIVLEAVRQYRYSLRFASSKLRKDKEFLLEVVKECGYSLEFLSSELRNNKEFVLEAVKMNGSALKYASLELRNNKEFVLEAVKRNGSALQYASLVFRNNKEVVLESLRQKRSALQYASLELRNDKEIVLEGVKINGLTLFLASLELQNDKEIVLEAVKRNGSALQYASLELQNDKEIVLESVKQNGLFLEFASFELRNDKEVLLEAVKQNGKSLELASLELQNDKEVVLEAVKQNGRSLQYASLELRNDREVVLEAVKNYGLSLQYASLELRNDKEVVLEAVKQNGKSIGIIEIELQGNINFVSTALLIDMNVWKYLSMEIKRRYLKMSDSLTMDSMKSSEEIKNDQQLVTRAIKCTPSSFSLASDRLQKDEDFILKVSKDKPEVILHVSNPETLQNVISRNLELLYLFVNDGIVSDLNFLTFLKEVLGIYFSNRSKIEPDTIDKIFMKLVEIFFNARKYHHSLESLSLWSKLCSELDIEGLIDFQIEVPISRRILKKISDRFDPLFLLWRDFIYSFSEGIDLEKIIPVGKFSMDENELKTFLFKLSKEYSDIASRKFIQFLSTIKNNPIDPTSLQINKDYPKTRRKKKDKNQRSFFLRDPITNQICGLGIDFVMSIERSGFFNQKKQKIYSIEFIGRYKNGLKEGEGILYDPNLPKSKSCVYHGYFLNDLKHGKGTEYGVIEGMNHYQTIYEGTFNNGNRDGDGEYYDNKNNLMIRGVWKDGKLIKTISKYKLDFWDWDLFIKKSWNVKKIGVGIGAFGKIIKIPSSCIPNIELKEEFVAVKIFHGKHTSNKNHYEMIIRDIKRSMDCLSLVKEKKYFCNIYGVIKGEKRIGYVMELAKTSMDLVIQSKKKIEFSEKLRILTETARGMKNLHDEKIMHRDLKWQNVLLCEDGQVRITDFDTIREDESSWKIDIEHTTTGRGTAAFYAPERNKRFYGLSVDVFSFGIMIYSLIFEENSPFRTQYQCSCGAKKFSMGPIKLISCIRKHNFRPLLDESKINSIPLNYKFLISLMTLCWEKRVSKRPTFSEIVKMFEEKQCCIVNVIKKVKKSEEEEEEEEDIQPFRILLMKSSLEELKKSIEERMRGYKVGKMEHSSIGELFNDENLKIIIEKEDEPKIFVTFSQIPPNEEVEEKKDDNNNKWKEKYKKLKKQAEMKEEENNKKWKEMEKEIERLIKKDEENSELKKLVNIKNDEIEKLNKYQKEEVEGENEEDDRIEELEKENLKMKEEIDGLKELLKQNNLEISNSKET